MFLNHHCQNPENPRHLRHTHHQNENPVYHDENHFFDDAILEYPLLEIPK